MTNPRAEQQDGRQATALATRTAPSLSLRRVVPPDWHHDRPAYAGDPYMDWESSPEPPVESHWTKGLAGLPAKH